MYHTITQISMWLMERRHELQVLLIGQRNRMRLRWHTMLAVVQLLRGQRAAVAVDASRWRNWLMIAAATTLTTIIEWLKCRMIGLHVLFEGTLLSKTLATN